MRTPLHDVIKIDEPIIEKIHLFFKERLINPESQAQNIYIPKNPRDEKRTKRT